MNCAKARCSKAIWPRITVKRAPDNLAPVSKSKPKGAPKSTWSLTSKSKLRGVPILRTSTLSFSSRPTGTVSLGMLGKCNNKSSNCSCTALYASSACFNSSPKLPTSAMMALASSPLLLAMPICLDTWLRLACNSCAVVCKVLRCSSNWLNCTASNVKFLLCMAWVTRGISLRNTWISNMVLTHTIKTNIVAVYAPFVR